jgi:hypothetical protein
MPSPRFEQFLIRARFHWTAWSIAEYAGLGLLCGCCCVFLLLPMLLWRGQHGQGVAIVLPSCGAALGAIIGFRRRPALRAVAQFADERFQTADLLATALALRGSNEPWNLNILNMADTFSIGLSPALLTPHQLGRRAWSGIAIALASAITLGFLSITTALDRAQAASVSADSNAWRAWQQNEAIQQDSPNHQIAAREARAEISPDSQSPQDLTDRLQGRSSDQSSIDQSRPRQEQADAGTGQGSAQSDSSPGKMPTIHIDRRSPIPANAGPIASAGAGHEVKPSSEQSASAGQISPEQGDSVVSWRGAGWPAAKAKATAAIQSGLIPDTYRNLVHDYFQDQDAPAGLSPRQ